MAKRVVCVVGGAACLAALLANASATLKLALAGLEGGGWVAYALAPLAFLATFLFYLAPAALLPGAISRAWRGEGDRAVRRHNNNSLQAPREHRDTQGLHNP